MTRMAVRIALVKEGLWGEKLEAALAARMPSRARGARPRQLTLSLVPPLPEPVVEVRPRIALRCFPACPLLTHLDACVPGPSALVDAGGSIGLVRQACFDVYDQRCEAEEMMYSTTRYDDPRIHDY